MEFINRDYFDKFVVIFLATVIIIFLAEILLEIVRKKKTRKFPQFLKGNACHWLFSLSLALLFVLKIMERVIFDGHLQKIELSGSALCLTTVLLSMLSYYLSEKKSKCSINLIGYLCLWIFLCVVHLLKASDKIQSSTWQSCPFQISPLLEIAISTNSIILFVIDFVSLISLKLSKNSQVNQFSEDTEFVHNYCSFPSKVTYHWANKMLIRGFKKPLDHQDLGAIPWVCSSLSQACRGYLVITAGEENGSLLSRLILVGGKGVFWIYEDVEVYYQRLKKEIEREKMMSEKKSRQFSLWRCLWYTSRKAILFSGMLQFFSASAMIMSPLFLDWIISSLEHIDALRLNSSTVQWNTTTVQWNATTAQPDIEQCPGSAHEYFSNPYILSILMLATYLFQIMLRKYHDFLMTMEAIRLKSAIQACIFEKSLNLKMMHVNEGKFINHMAIDATQIINFSPAMHCIWSLPALVMSCLLLLILQLGKAGGIGCMIVFLLVPVQYFLGRFLGVKQDQIMDIADRRLMMTNEMLDNIKLLKMYSWENLFCKRVVGIRDKEISTMWKTSAARIIAALITDGIPAIACLIMFILRFYLESTNVMLSKVFSSTVIFMILANELFFLIVMMVTFIKTRTSMERLGEYFTLPQIHQQEVSNETEKKSPKKAQKRNRNDDSKSIELLKKKEITLEEGSIFRISHGTFAWHQNPVLNDINFTLPKGKLTMLLGPVGSGKSSLLWAILGEMEKVKGDQEFCELPLVMVPQRAWILNATIKDNIVFGQKFDEDLYDEIITSCTLDTDFNLLPDGDATEIGEKGANLSGGQKQRVGLARALYQNAEVYLLDDTLSALDPHVAATIFERVVLDRLLRNGKTVLLVTHNTGLLKHADNVVIMLSGGIAYQGRPDECPESLKSHLQSESDSHAYKHPNVPKIKPLNAMPERLRLSSLSIVPLQSFQEKQDEVVHEEEPLKLIVEEERQIGATPLYFPIQYMKLAGVHFIILSVLLYSFRMAMKIAGDYFLGVFIEHSEVGRLDVVNLMKFCIFTCSSIILIPICVVDVEWFCLRASKNIHNKIINSFAAAPIRFFDTTPTGRILNRMSADLNIIDLEFNSTFDCVLFLVTFVSGSLITNCFFNPLFLIPGIPILVVSLLIQRFFIASCRELQRLDCVSKSHILSHFSQVLSGLHVIRMSGCQERFQRENFNHINKNALPLLFQHLCNSWMAVRQVGVFKNILNGHDLDAIIQDLLGGIIVFASCLCSLYAHHRGYLDTNEASVAMLYAVCNSSFMFWTMKYISNVEILTSNIQRLVEYCDLKSEGEDEDKKPDPPTDWPKTGNLQFKNVCLTYDKSLKPVVEDLNLTFQSGHKVGICGRTGSGKSTLTLGIFRLVDICGGQILLDDVDISSVPINELRKRLAIIPQDPVIFSGSIRFNLDPHSLNSDEELWTSLEVSQLRDLIANMPQKLETEVSSNRCSLSLGERQLLCLARALLRNSKVLVMDEATASIDESTDRTIQGIIKEAFKGRTVINIAHRISTIIDSNLVVVMQGGQLIEEGNPRELLMKKSVFASMANAN